MNGGNQTMAFNYDKVREMAETANIGYTSVVDAAIKVGNTEDAIKNVKTSVKRIIGKGPGANDENATYQESILKKTGLYQKIELAIMQAQNPVSVAQATKGITDEFVELEGLLIQTALENIPADGETDRSPEKSLGIYRVTKGYEELRKRMHPKSP